VEILGYTGKEAQVSVPDHIGDIPVVSIAANAFSHNHDLTAVTLPETLQSIGDYAFFLCANLTALTIPANVREIGLAAFGFCNKMELTLDPDNQWFYLLDGILYNRYCSRLLFCSADVEKLRSPVSLTAIDPYAFANRTSLQSIYFAVTVDNIGEGAFLNCAKVYEISFLTPNSSNWELNRNTTRPIAQFLTNYLYSRSVEWAKQPMYIGKDAFKNCDSLRNKSVFLHKEPKVIAHSGNDDFLNELNDYYHFTLEKVADPSDFSDPVQEGDWLYRTCPLYTEILKYTGTDTDVTVPDKLGGKTVLSIADEAFAHQAQLFSVALPASLYLLGSGVFLGCTKLDTVTISKENPVFKTDAKSGVLYRHHTLILLPVARLLRENLKPADYDKMRLNIEQAILKLWIGRILPGAINGNDRFTCFFLSSYLPAGHTDHKFLSIEENAFYNCQALRRIYTRCDYTVNLQETGNEDFMNAVFLNNDKNYEGNRFFCASTGVDSETATAGVRPGFVLGGEAITAADARIALRRSVDLETFDAFSREYLACDIDNDRIVSADDARHILRASVDLEDPFTEWPVYTGLRLKLTKNTANDEFNYVLK
ncbi:MAG: leucine-rich repeat domain-containing protein, partial [Clostridia bacterium]|nr:leucine-rich repeat domain-containing protein [Clostridia bacterium]